MRPPGSHGRLALVVSCALVVAATWLAVTSPAFGQANGANDRCFACHAKSQQKQIVVNGVSRGLTVAPAVYNHSFHSLLDCTSCHVGFEAHDHTVAETQGWFEQATLTACTTCHAHQATAYRVSVHGARMSRPGGLAAAPSCGTCHGSHDVGSVDSAAFRRRVTRRCQDCHHSRSQTYLDTYHGKAFELGRGGAATCYDCHGSHLILPQDDPRSTVSSRRVVATCARCHPGANASFASYRVHLSPTSPGSSWLVFTVNSLYILLIATVFTFGGVHSVLYFWRGRRQGLYSKH